MDTGDAAVLCMTRCCEGERLTGLFNFSEYEKTVSLHEIGIDGKCRDMISGDMAEDGDVHIPAYGFYYLKSM